MPLPNWDGEVTSYGNVADMWMSPRKYFFEKVELCSGHPRRIPLELFVKFLRLRQHELIDLGIQLGKKLDRRRIENDRAGDGLSQRWIYL